MFRAHHAIGAAVGFARDHGNFRNGGFRIRIEQLGAVADDAAELLAGPRQKPWYVFEGEDRDLESVAEAYEARAFGRGIDIQAAGEMSWLVRHHAYGFACQAGKADED